MVISRIISALVVVSYLVFIYVSQDMAAVFDSLLLMIIPLGCIWFSDELGGTDPGSGDETSRKSYQVPIAITGWIILLLPIIFRVASLLVNRPAP